MAAAVAAACAACEQARREKSIQGSRMQSHTRQEALLVSLLKAKKPETMMWCRIFSVSFRPRARACSGPLTFRTSTVTFADV